MTIHCTQLRANEIWNALESLGWKHRGGHGSSCGYGCEYWGYSIESPRGEVAFFDFTKVNATDMVSCKINGIPDAIAQTL